MADVETMELLIILAIVVVLFGASRIGDIGKGLSRGNREFRYELHEAMQEEPAKPADAVTTGITPASVTTMSRSARRNTDRTRRAESGI